MELTHVVQSLFQEKGNNNQLVRIPVELSEINGSHVKLLTNTGKTKQGIRTAKVLADICKSFGTKQKEELTEDFFLDKVPYQICNHLIYEIRQATFGYPRTFDFKFRWESNNPKKKGKKQMVQLEEYTEERDHKLFHPDMTFGELTKQGWLVVYKQYADEDNEDKGIKKGDLIKGYGYDFVEDEEYLKTLDIVKKKAVRWQCPTLRTIGVLSKINMDNTDDIEVTFSTRGVSIFEVTGKNKDGTDDGYWKLSKGNKWSLPLIAALRKAIEKYEGTCDTRIKFDHPEAQYENNENKVVYMDMLSEPNFFSLSLG